MRERRLTAWEGEATAVWEERWGVPRFEAWESVGSTNDRLRRLAEEGAEAWTVVTAEEQTAGRGRGGRAWHSPAGAGLWLSFLAGTGAAPIRPVTPILVGVALSRAVARCVGRPPPRIKWPNDLWLDGRKVAGVLCEAAGEGRVVVGVGVNLRPPDGGLPEALRNVATCLEEVSGRPLSRSALAGALLREARALLTAGRDGLSPTVAAELEALDALRGRPVRCSSGVRGVARGIGPDGALLVEETDGRRSRIVSGSVRLEEAR